MNEAAYQRKLINKIKALLPGCEILKNNPRENQGVPDILILFNERWSALEVKLSERARRQPNQEYYIDKFNEMSFASFISPDNEMEVLDELQRAMAPN